jgi:hypothetical protein
MRGLRAEYNRIKRIEFPWAYEFTNLGHAFDNYWRMKEEGTQPKLKHPRKDGEEAGFPHFKSKKRDQLSFYLANDKFSVHGHTIRIPKLGEVNMAEELRFAGKILSAVISERAGWWFLALSVEVEHGPPRHPGGVVGIDLGLKTLATLSEGGVFENQRHYRRNLGRSKGRSKGLEPWTFPQAGGQPQLAQERGQAGEGTLPGGMPAGGYPAQTHDAGRPRLHAHRPGRPERAWDAPKPLPRAVGRRRQLLRGEATTLVQGGGVRQLRAR